MSSILTFSLILLQSLYVLTQGQTCRHLPSYARCSSNPDCGCLPFTSSDDQSGICAYLHLNASKLRTCDERTYYCDHPYTVCVHHPTLSSNQPLCYPTGMATLDLCPSLFPTLITNSTVEEVCLNVSWAKKGLTVAGSNYTGTDLQQLRNPSSILFDVKTNVLYVADNGNKRIVVWQADAKRGSVLAGDNGEGNRTDQFAWISDMLMDPKDGSLVVCDARNKRVVRWAKRAQQGDILIDKLYCTGLAMDKEGLLYISEHDTHQVTRWILGENITKDEIVAGGNRKGNQLNQLNEPSSVFVDQNGTVYVADYSNERIMKWPKDAKEGILVGKLRWPKTVHLDSYGNIYSIDGYYSRVIRWTPNSINGTTIIGEQQYTLSQADDLAFDLEGNVFVSNYGNGRVDKFLIDKSAC